MSWAESHQRDRWRSKIKGFQKCVINCKSWQNNNGREFHTDDTSGCMLTEFRNCNVKFLSPKITSSSSFILKTSLSSTLKLGSNVCSRVDNQTTGDTLQDLTRPHSRKKRHQPVIHPWVLERVFGGRMPFHTNQLGLGKRQWNLETSSAAVEFPSKYIKVWDERSERRNTSKTHVLRQAERETIKHVVLHRELQNEY